MASLLSPRIRLKTSSLCSPRVGPDQSIDPGEVVFDNRVGRRHDYSDFGPVPHDIRHECPPSGSLVCGMTFRLQEHYQGGGLVLPCASLTTLETWPSQVEGASLLRK